MGGGSGSPAQQTDLEASQRRARLFSLVEELAQDQRRVVVARFAEEKSIAEIANELGRSEGAVKQLQFRALQNLRQRLGDELSDRNE
jgi:RNA polymerase sigma-70 factor (ECF subfamily)